jgi:hypothetical protein
VWLDSAQGGWRLADVSYLIEPLHYHVCTPQG